MDYNSNRKQLVLPEYGRNVQKMVDFALTVEDQAERNLVAKSIIAIMGNMYPHLRDVSDFRHKLWDHLAIMSDFKLDIDSPYETPTKEKLQEKPDKLPYNNQRIKYRHYGKTIEALIAKAIEIEEPKEDWEQVGQVGFNNMEVSNGSLDMADSGDVFAMTADYVSSTGMSVYGVYQLNNDSWELVGTEESSQGFSYSRVRMSVSPDGVPYVYDGASSVKKLENNAWIQVGSSLSNYDYCTLAFAPDGKLWFFGVLNGSGQALVLDNGTWVNQGMIHNDIMVFTTVKFDSNAYPVVLYATNFSPSLGYSQVSRWNGTSFDLVSGGYIHDSQVAWNHGLAITSTDEIYVGMSLIDDNDNMWLFKLENNSWNVIDSNITGGAIGECHLDTDDEDNVIIAYTDVLESEAVSVLKYDGTDFVYMGIPGFTGEGSSLEGLTMEGSNPWVLYKEATMGENPSVKKYVDLRPGDPSSTADNVVDRTIQVFPNPTTGVFTLKYEYAKSFEVIDLMGRMVQNGQIMESDNSQIEVNMSTSANGVYLLTVHGKNKTEVIQLVVQH